VEAAQASTGDAIRVMVVDDSAVVRGLISRTLERDGEVVVVRTVSNGEQAVKQLAEVGADVVILDIEMPVMDGLTAIPKLLEVDPEVKIIMASTLTEKNAEVSIRAMQAGAADYIPKPSTSKELTGNQPFGDELLAKVKTLGRTVRKEKAPVAAKSTPATQHMPGGKPITLRPRPVVVPKPNILAVGSSTGGPQALFEFFKGLKGVIDVPIVVTQHMPPTFTTILAQHISRAANTPAQEAAEGDVLEPGKIYVAPGDYHMTIVERGGKHVVHLNQDPPENFCRPAVDPMLRSLVKAYGGKILVVILTGMGFDGQKGSEVVVKAGGMVVAQDEATSVVWGMPGAVAEAGLCSAVLPLKEIASHVATIFKKSV